MKAAVDQSSVVLLTSAQAGLRESGSGFVVHVDAQAAYVVTCHHVVRYWEPENIRANGKAAQILCTGDGAGIDLAVLKVPGLVHLAALRLTEFGPTPNTKWYGYGFHHLYGEDYVRRRLEGRASRTLAIQGKSADRAISAWQFTASTDEYAIQPGNSGSPLIDPKAHHVVGIVSHALNGGRSGIAIAPSAVQIVWPGLSSLASPRAETTSRSKPAEAVFGTAPERPDIPAPPPKGDSPDDPWKGQFGRRSAQAGRALSAKLTLAERDYFYFDLIVRSTDRSELAGPARFYLHDSYARSIIDIRTVDKDQTLSLRDVYSYGVYTVGCHVRDANGKWVALEYDLKDLPKLPRRFLTR